jgi:hypothetical protein
MLGMISYPNLILKVLVKSFKQMKQSWPNLI